MMNFNYVLTNLLVDVPHAVGAIFVDPEGEAVDWVTRHNDPFDLKIEGAYHSIFMRRLDRLASSVRAGSIDAFVVEGTDMATLTQALPEGYYVVLVVDRTGSRAQALYRLRNAAQAIARDIV
jgi:predicted regulator of Ras-like GTPase activity (Roadblock/LC7/MglB family)